jgi:NADPH:quinone reductase-like Zn-dependent oxidoreductase
MKAAIVESFDHPPHYGETPPPTPAEGECVVTVKAAALSQLAKAQASGAHYSSETRFPLVPGADGVGRVDDGRRVYFAFPRAPHGSMAEQSVAPRALLIDLPDDLDDVTAAAIANPGMSSWAGLTERAGFQRGQSVLVHGATGSSGRLAVQVAKHLGAHRVIATGRNHASLESLLDLGADAVVALDQAPEKLRAELAEHVAKGIDVVLDYIFGPTAEAVVGAFVNRGPARVRYVQIGSMAGSSITLPSAPLRSSGLEIVGSGLGSVPRDRLIACIRDFLKAVVPAGFTIETRTMPLAEVAAGWSLSGPARVVFTT